MERPREVYMVACTEIGGSLSPYGFKFARSGPHAQRKDAEFTYRVSFQSSHNNTSGSHVALWIHASVISKRLADWRASNARTIGSGDRVAGGQIGNLVRPHGWRTWNLAGSTRPAVIADATAVVHAIALPYFDRFADIPGLCVFLQRQELPAMQITHAIEFLLCFADRSAANAALSNFFCSHSDLLVGYHTHLQEFKQRGLPQFVFGSGYARELAFATIVYGLTPPSAADGQKSGD